LQLYRFFEKASGCQSFKGSSFAQNSLEFFQKGVNLYVNLAMSLVFFSRSLHLRMTMKKTTILLLLLVCYSMRWQHLRFWKLTIREMSLKQETPTWESRSRHLNFMPPFTQPGKMLNVSCSFQLTLWRLWVLFSDKQNQSSFHSAIWKHLIMHN